MDGLGESKINGNAAGDIPLAASVGFGLLRDDLAIYSTAGTNIPFGAAAPDLRPPAAHPNENTLWAVGLDGEPRWAWHGDQRLAGLTASEDGRTLVVGAGERVTDQRRDLYGALLFDIGAVAPSDDAVSGADRLRAVCSTEGPTFFRHATTADGRIAVAEYPYRNADDTLGGTYRVSVFR